MVIEGLVLNIQTLKNNMNINIGSSLIPQKNVENLEQDISTLAEGVMMRRDELNAFKEKQNWVNVQADVNKSVQDEWNKNTLAKIESLTKETMIMFFMIILLFIIDLSTIWYYIRK